VTLTTPGQKAGYKRKLCHITLRKWSCRGQNCTTSGDRQVSWELKR